MLLNILVLMVLCVLELVLLFSINGVILRLNVSDVIRIGCSCMWVVFRVVLSRVWFWFFRFLVNFVIRIVFFVDRLMVVNSFIWKKMLFLSFCSRVVSIVLIMFKGMISIIVNGID